MKIKGMFVVLMLVMVSIATCISGLASANSQDPQPLTYITSVEKGGWKYFSLPFGLPLGSSLGSSILKDDLRVQYNGSYYTLAEAEDAGIVIRFIGQFDNEEKRWSWVNELTPGLAHCMFSYKKNVKLYVRGDYSESNSYVADLFYDWNYVGMPCSEPVNISDLRVHHSGTDYTFDEAVDAGILLRFIYWYDADWVSHTVDEKLLPGEAYLFFSYKNKVSISIEEHDIPEKPLSIAVSPTVVDEGDDFTVTVTSEGEKVGNATVTFNDMLKVTDSSGETVFTAPQVNKTRHFNITANKSGYLPAATTVTIRNVVQDVTPPETTCSVSGETIHKKWYVSDVTITLDATDDMSGIATTYYAVDRGPYIAYEKPFTVEADGVHVIHYYSVDHAGNTEETNSIKIHIDTAPPVTEHRIHGETRNGRYYVGPVSVELMSSDDTSGVERTYFSVDGSMPKVYRGQFEIRTQGKHVVKYYSKDVAGNTEQGNTITFELERESEHSFRSDPRLR